jgi:von Willebrand factor type A domain
MSKKSLVRWIVLPVTMVAVGVLMGQSALGADSSPVAAHMDTFANPDGVSSFALSIKPTAVAPTPGGRDIVVLFNTSASQTGDYRVKAIDALKGFLAGLAAGDRVRLVAVDLNAIPLTKTFVAPNGQEMASALADLDARVPLGATDMAKALDAVVDSYNGESKKARAAVYIGDGRSAAHLLETDEFGKLAGRLADARIPLSSYAVGLRLDPQLLGSLAVQSGGTVILGGELPGGEAGQALAAAADTTVLWPTSVTWPAEMKEVFPKRMPPLRSDRETIVLGTLKGKEPLKVQFDVAGAAGPEKIAMTVSPGASDERNTYLTPLVERARVDGGVTLPLVGSVSLAEARQMMDSGVRNLDRLARQALASGNFDGAEKLIDEALRQDPNDTEALSLKSVVAKRKQGGAAAAGTAATPPPKPVAAKPAAEGAPPAGGASDLNLVGPPQAEPPAGALAEGFEHDRRVIAQVIQAEVQNVLNKARLTMSTDPDTASQQLKLTLEKVRQTGELDPDTRDQFVDSLQSALREASARKVTVEQARQERQASMSAASERLLAASKLERNQLKVKELMERFNSLMSEKRYRDAEEAAASEAEKLVPGNPVPVLATLEARMVGYYSNFMDSRLARQKGVVDTLYQVEKSHVPFPDEPPIVYPDAEVWQQLTARRKEKYSSMDLAKKGSAEKKIEEALKSPTEVVFVETPLQDVIEYLKDRHKIEIKIDTHALTDLGIGTDTPVTIDLKGISLRSALRLMLKELGLTYLIKDEVLQITTPEEADNQLSTKVYPVADLVLPIPQGGMGGMGGMMGGMGGMMGGMGGMGGGMGGMGGMGGGMGGMGGGMFNMPPNLLPKVPPGGFQAFSVKDDLNVPSKTATGDRAPTQTVPVTIDNQPVKIDNRPAKIEIEIEEGAKPEVVWDRYFSKNDPQPKAVRTAVRRLMSEQKFDHVIALIGAALRHRQCQSWMYEALALAMEAAGRPKADMERAIMSAVDFVDNATDLMYIGAYLSRMGLDNRALQVYRQAASLAPLQPEPYMLGLRAARAANDLEGLKWASLGILSQAWPKEQASVWQAGLGVSKEVLDKLRSEKRTKEADAFEAAMNEALQRDCVAIVRWTGEGEVDLLVGEPSGTVCSLRNPRSTAGGILLGDDIRQTGRDNFGGHSQVYVCPRGFDGKYRMLVRRVWGSVTAGKVTVEVATHCNTPNAIDVRKRISLDKDEAIVAFDLINGRRKEAIRDQQVANVVNRQLALNRQILAQQIGSSLDQGTMSGLAQSRAAANNPGLPFFGGGAVGYAPQIIWLPEGAQLMGPGGGGVTAVVSADRRYVRISAAPFFSGVSQVNTFNTTSGASQSQTGGTGNQGYSGGFGGTGNSGIGGGIGGGSGGGIF